MEDGGADAQPNGIGEGLHRGVAQYQNGLLDICLPKLQRLQHGADTEKGAVPAEMPRNFHRAVAIGICLDNGHDRYTGPGFYFVYVMPNGVQIND